MKKITSLLFFTVALLSAINASAFTMRPNMLFSAKMDGSQEVPAVTGTGIGVTSLMLNANRDSLCVNMTFSGLSGSVTGVHIHSGGVGVNGPVVVNLGPFMYGNRVTGVITGTALTAALKTGMLTGMMYVNVHTAANPGGEIRGQIMLETDHAFTGVMSGSQEVPAVTTTANGYAVFNLSHDETMVNFYVVTNGLSGAINAAHIHAGAAGVSGGVIQNLGMFISGNVIMGSFTPSANVVNNLKAGTAYINVHTTQNPSGEIRGQLRMDNKIAFDAWLEGAQEVPPVTTSAKGVSSLRLNAAMDSLWYWVYTTGLSGAITNAHIHNGIVGVSGGVAVGFTGISGNVISGTITGSALTSTLINNMLRGATYVNVHTAANPSGEIRGQIWRVMREGFTLSMDGAQENPQVSTTASGSGLVSINRDLNNAHYMIVTNSVTPSGMHFHKALIGTNGGVVRDIMSTYSNNGNFGYWKSTDSSPFTTASANQFDKDSIYVNSHTTAHTSGEIRGQVLSGYKCVASQVVVVTGLSSVNLNEEQISLFPNPAHETLNVSLAGIKDHQVSITVFDVAGKVIATYSPDVHHGSATLGIDTRNYAPGMYFVKINTGTEISTHKIIIE